MNPLLMKIAIGESDGTGLFKIFNPGTEMKSIKSDRIQFGCFSISFIGILYHLRKCGEKGRSD